MKTNSQFAMKGAAAGALLLLLATPSFAQSRGWDRNDSNRTTQSADRDNRRGGENGYRENQRVTLSGRVTSFSRERDGYRVQLDRPGQSFWAPRSTFGGRNLRAGISISIGGVFRGGTIYADAVNWPDNYGSGYGYDNGVVRGVVDRIDVRTGTLWLRNQATGRLIAADLPNDRYSRVSLRGLRRGDYVELSGQWSRGGVFDVARVDNVRNGRY